jgi:hypothetical protein
VYDRLISSAIIVYGDITRTYKRSNTHFNPP